MHYRYMLFVCFFMAPQAVLGMQSPRIFHHFFDVDLLNDSDCGANESMLDTTFGNDEESEHSPIRFSPKKHYDDDDSNSTISFGDIEINERRSPTPGIQRRLSFEMVDSSHSDEKQSITLPKSPRTTAENNQIKSIATLLKRLHLVTEFKERQQYFELLNKAIPKRGTSNFSTVLKLINININSSMHSQEIRTIIREHSRKDSPEKEDTRPKSPVLLEVEEENDIDLSDENNVSINSGEESPLVYSPIRPVGPQTSLDSPDTSPVKNDPILEINTPPVITPVKRRLNFESENTGFTNVSLDN